MSGLEQLSGGGNVVEERRRPKFWIIATFSLLALLLVWVLWVALAPRTIRLARPGGSAGGPSVSEVEAGMRRFLTDQGAIEDVRCHREGADVWGCTVFFAGGHFDLTKAVWYPSQRTLGLSVVHRFAK